MTTNDIPRNWSYAKIGLLCNLINGRAFKPTEWVEAGMPIIRIQNLNNPNASFNHFNGDLDPRHLVQNGDLLFAWSGTPGTSFGAHVWNGSTGALNQHIFKIDFDERYIDKKFFKFAINQKLEELISLAHGGVGLRHVTKGKFEETEIAFPALPEQKQIAAKLNKLLAQVDTIKTRLDAIPHIIKRFRQSVLAAAVSGKLTCGNGAEFQHVNVDEPWTHRIDAPVNWKRYKFADAVSLIGGSQPPKSEFISEHKPGYVRLIQIRDYKSDHHLVYIPKNLARRFCSKTDVMIGRYGPPIFQILRGLEGAYNVALMKADPASDRLDREYLYWYLQNYKLYNYVEAGSDRTAGQSGVNKKFLEIYPIFIPPLQEQTEIVRRVEQLFAYADQIEQRVKDAQARVNHLTQSILAKAFRGELTADWRAQNPDLISGENSAEALLTRIRAEREATASKPKTRQRRARV